MPLSPEVEKFLSRLKPDTRAELEERFQPDAITLLASIENPALIERLNTVGEWTETLFAMLNYSLDTADYLVRRQEADAFIHTAMDLKAFRNRLTGTASGE